MALKVLKQTPTRLCREFRPGVYRHYKGGLYLAMFLALDSETSKVPIRVVVYTSLVTGDVHTRPYSDSRYKSWSDNLLVRDEDEHEYWLCRFEYVGVQPQPQETTHDGTA